jgi:hypothetical protein
VAEKGPFVTMAEYLDEIDRSIFDHALARVQACVYTDENGKEWIDGGKLIRKPENFLSAARQ